MTDHPATFPGLVDHIGSSVLCLQLQYGEKWGVPQTRGVLPHSHAGAGHG